MQSAFFEAVLTHAQWSALPIYAVPNFSGHYGTKLQRTVAGVKAKRGGRRKGVPDVIIDVARAGAHGLRIEFKVPGAKPQPEQDEWHAAMREQGFLVCVCTSTEQATRLLDDYLHNGDLARHLDATCHVEMRARASRRAAAATRPTGHKSASSAPVRVRAIASGSSRTEDRGSARGNTPARG